MSAPLLATWLYAEPEGEESAYPQVIGKGASSSGQFQAVYWRCVAIFFASITKWSPDSEKVLYTNVEVVPDVDGHRIGAFLDTLGVDVVLQPYTFQPPPGYFGSWGNQFYVFDVIRRLSARTGGQNVAMLLDSDCVLARPVDRMAAMTERHGALTYDLGLPADEIQNGLTSQDMEAIYTELASPFEASIPDAPPPYIGGELVAATGALLRRMNEILDPLWADMMRRHGSGRPKFNEEAHALSFVYHALGVPYGTANPYLRRIWTTLLSGDDARAPDLDLTFWHVPGEKRYGLRRLFAEIFDRTSRFWSLEDDAWRRWAGAELGIPRRTLRKLALDVPIAARDKVRSKTGS